MRNRWDYPSSRIPWENKSSPCFSFFSFYSLSPPPPFSSPLYGLPSLFLNSKSTHYPFLCAHPTICFCLHTLYCPAGTVEWQPRQKSCRRGTPDLLRVGGVCPLYSKCISHHSPFCFVFVLFFLTTKVGFANILEIKCNCFF